jgi:CoA:oxalate CoA-transferase
MLPLEGVRVLTLENFIAAPVATMWLADAGADVVKVERPGTGDASRGVEPRRRTQHENRSLSFIRANRNKRSIELDLKMDRDRAVFDDLLGATDVFIENLRPSALEQLGLTYEAVRKINPRIIYGAISGFGLPEFNGGDLPFHPALDIVAQAMGGLLFRAEGSEHGPVYSGFPMADICASTNLQSAVYQALYHRERTGEGACIDISMLDGVVAFNELVLIMYDALGKIASPGQHGLAAPFGSYATADGYVVIAVLGEPVWQRFTRAIGKEEITDLPDFASGILRHEHKAILDEYINAWLGTMTTDEVVARLRAYDVPASPVLNIPEVIKLDNLHERGMILNLEDPAWGRVQMAGNPINSTLMKEMPAHPAPRLGAHTREVLEDWLSADKLVGSQLAP